MRYRRFSQTPSPQPTTPATPTTPFNPMALLGGLAAVAVALGVVFFTLKSREEYASVIVVQSIDVSASGQQLLATTYRQFCPALTRHLLTGDGLVSQLFADRPTITRLQEVDNLLSLGQQCETLPTANAQETGLGKAEGTSPLAALSQIELQVKKLRAEGERRPVVVQMLLHQAEPVADREQFNTARMNAWAQKLADLGVVLVITGPTGQLQEQLQTAFQGHHNAQVFPASSCDTAVSWGMERARRMKL
jgi:hypothetical protein